MKTWCQLMIPVNYELEDKVGDWEYDNPFVGRREEDYMRMDGYIMKPYATINYWLSTSFITAMARETL